MSAIFISHSSRDNVLARTVEQHLGRRQYHSVFLDLDPEKGIVGGQSWERTLYRKLRACRAVIAVCTDDYLRSHWCFAEIALARMEGKPVIGLLADPLDAGAALPALLTERQLIDLRQSEEEGFARLWRALDQLDLTGVATNWNPKEPPYLGLNAYQEEHAPVFFGREEEALAGLELLDRGAPGLVLVLGASGSGKSSLVRAGMLPRLRSRDDWLIVDPFRPGRDPWAELTESLVRAFGRYAPEPLDESARRQQLRDRIRADWSASVSTLPPHDMAPEVSTAQSQDAPDDRVLRLIDLIERLHDDPPPPLTTRVQNYLEWSLDDLRRLSASPGDPTRSSPAASGGTPLLDAVLDLRRLSHRRNARVLVVIDQFEELLGREKTDDGVHGFLTLVRASIEAEHSPLTVLCTMRSDFLGLFQQHPALQSVDFESLSLGPMRVDGMRRVITMPARLAAIEIEDGLVDRLLADTGTPDALPLLSFTLWVMCRDRREDERLAVAVYERLGGLQGTITREADAVLATAAREQKQDDLRRALLQMARLGDDGNYSRRPVDWDSPDIQRVQGLLATLVDRRVLVMRMDGDRRVIEVAHEALFRAWTPLTAWLGNARAELLLKQQIERDAVTWRDNGRPPDTLWRGGRLLQAHDLVGRDADRLRGADLSTEFVRAGMRRRTRQRAILVTTGAAILAALTGFLGFALVQADLARKEQARTLDMARVAIAGEWLPRDPTSGALVLLELGDPANTRFAPRRLGDALSQRFVRAEFRHPGPVHSVAISPDGSRVLTTSKNAAMVWDARTGRLLRTLPHQGGVIDAAFDPAGRHILTRAGTVGERYFEDGMGNVARVWGTESGKPRFAVTHADVLNSAVFSPDGRWLVTTSDDDTAQLWDVRSGQHRFTWRHEDDVQDAVFSPDSRLVVTLLDDAARVGSVESGQPVTTLTHDGSMDAASFSPDGAFLATAGYQGVKAWDVKTWTAQRTFAADLVRQVSFSPDGRYLLTASNQEVRVWDFDTGSEMFKEPIVHRNLVFARFSQGGSFVITAAGQDDRRGYGSPQADNAVRYWDARTGERRFEQALTFGSEVMQVAFGPRLETLVLNSAQRVGRGRFETLREDATARLWDVALPDKRRLGTAMHDTAVSAVSFSPDGRRLLTVAGPAARLWDVESGKPVASLIHDDDVLTAAFDGSVIVTSSEDGTARVWDAETGQPRFLAKHKETVEDAMLIANGRLLATMSESTVRLWTVAADVAGIGAHVFEMPDDGDPTARDVWRDNFSPDGALAATRDDEVVTVRDVAGRRTRFTLKHGGFVRFAAFIDDGRSLVTGGDENVARVWDMATGRVKHTLEHPTQVAALALTPDGRTLLTLRDDGVGHLWDTATGKARVPLPHGCGASDARFVAGGTLAVTWSSAEGMGGDCESKAMIWDVATGAPRSSIATTSAESIGFSENARVMFDIERSLDGRASVRVWDVDMGEERFTNPFQSDERIRAAAASPDGRRVAFASGKAVSTWAVGGDLLQSILAASTTVCLQPEFRRQNLGEAAEKAVRAYDACERRHGRR